jgi:hypothetical protein
MVCRYFITRILVAIICKEGRKINEEVLAALRLPYVLECLEAHFVAKCVISLEFGVFRRVVLTNLDRVTKYFQISISLHKPHFFYFFKQFVPTILGNWLAKCVFILLFNITLKLFVFLLVHLELNRINYVF